MEDMDKKIEGSELQMGYCSACGQAKQFQTSGGVMQAHLDMWATDECNCEVGRIDRQIKKNHEKAEKNINNLFEKSFPETAEVLQIALPHILRDRIESITIKTGYNVTAKVSITSKGKVKVEKVENKKTALME